MTHIVFMRFTSFGSSGYVMSSLPLLREPLSSWSLFEPTPSWHRRADPWGWSCPPQSSWTSPPRGLSPRPVSRQDPPSRRAGPLGPAGDFRKRGARIKKERTERPNWLVWHEKCESVKVSKCQSVKVSESESARMCKCQNVKVPVCECVRIW